MMGQDQCPICKSKLDAVTSAEKPEYKPSPKDLTMCLYCGGILYFEEDMSLAEMPEVLIDTFDKETKGKIGKSLVAILKTTPKTTEFKDLRIQNAQRYASRLQG